MTIPKEAIPKVAEALKKGPGTWDRKPMKKARGLRRSRREEGLGFRVFRAFRVVRVFRVFRVFRVLRVLRVLKVFGFRV